MIASRQVLFICTGNYYRSRFAEHYFNFLTEKTNTDLSAFSRGTSVFDNDNVGPISREALEYLSHLNVPVPDPLRFPQPLLAEDFEVARIAIALDEKEHRPMLNNDFPDWVNQTIFWSFPDVHLKPAAEILPRLKRRVESFFDEII